jgi:hypothetical protein
MLPAPLFPVFRKISLDDRDILQKIVWAYQPETSELTFTNLFIWQPHYKTQWSMYKDWLIIICADTAGRLYALPPVGPPGRSEVAAMLLRWLRDDKKVPEPSLERADKKLAAEINQSGSFIVEPRREQFDYVYRSSDLISLAGRKYHGKKNHINKFTATCAFTYMPLEQSHIPACLEMQNKWCDCHRCAEDMNLMGEWEAIRDLLSHFEALNIQGGVILIDGRVEAFTIGELLNEQTAVVHIEKANTGIPGLYSMINQQFCEHAWPAVRYVNREQDLGDEGLRQAKLSYHPDHLVEKYRITLKAV